MILASERRYSDNKIYYIPIDDTTFELSVLWPSATESCFSDSVSLSFKTRLTSDTCFCGNVILSQFQA